MEGRIMHLVRIIENSEIVSDTDGRSDKVRAGSIVSVIYDGDDEAESYLVGSIEEQSDDLTVVSPGSPMGGALMGASIDDVIEYQAPMGPMIKVTVVGIE